MTQNLNPEGYSNWLLDFDDTLVTGWATWSIDHAFPQLIQQHNLKADPDLLGGAIIDAQKKAQTDIDPHSLLTDLFDSLGWPQTLITPLVQTLRTNYAPTLFEDSREFLEELKKRNCSVYMISNNPTAEKVARILGISDYFEFIITPGSAEVCRPKPSSTMWSYLKGEVATLNETNAIMLGDDPWSDADFARNCDLPCLIIDRLSRYPALDYGQSITTLSAALAFTSPRSMYQ